MSAELDAKVKALFDQQELVKETEKKLIMEQTVCENKLKEVLVVLGLNTNEKITYAELLTKTIDASKAP